LCRDEHEHEKYTGSLQPASFGILTAGFFRPKQKVASMNLTAIAGLVGFLIVSFLPATMGALFPPGAWYEQLAKPDWRPPNWLFAPAWTLLYLTIAISGWLVWQRVGFAGARLAFTVFLLQLVLNAAWTPLFFGLHRPDLAFIEIVVLWLSILATLALFYPIVPVAGLLLLPYLAWVTFAGALNFAIWRLNAG
jgi:benzodiazapine receptor